MMSVDHLEISEAIRAVGVSHGEVVMIHSDISRIGWPRNAQSRDQVPRSYLDAVWAVLGEEGTIVVLACTESYGREGRPYDHQASPSEQGVLSEYLRTRPHALRSLHPLFSVAAIGSRAEQICSAGIAPTVFGYNSPFQRMMDLDARVVCMGVDLLAMTFVHHVEQAFGVPYGYTKEWSVPVLYDGKPLDRRFFAFVRYLNSGIEYDFSRLRDDLVNQGLARTTRLGYGRVWGVRMRDVYQVGMARLSEDPFYFLAGPPTREPWRK